MKKNKISFFTRFRFKYRLSIINEDTLEESFYMRVSRMTVTLFLIFALILTFALFSGLIYYTPIKYFLPGFSDATIRSELVHENLRVDSLLNHVYLQEKQLDILKGIVSGDIKLDTVSPFDTVSIAHFDKLQLDLSSRESKFRANYEETEKYNISSMTATSSEQAYVFFKPLKGVSADGMTSEENTLGIKLVALPSEPVLSVLDGTVLANEYTKRDGYTIVVQHGEGYISVYKNIEKSLIKIGSLVKAGNVLGIAGEKGKGESGNYIYYELWYEGKAVNPSDYIAF